MNSVTARRWALALVVSCSAAFPAAATADQNTRITMTDVLPKRACERVRGNDPVRVLRFEASANTKVRIHWQGLRWGFIPYAGSVDQYVGRGANSLAFGMSSYAPVPIDTEVLAWDPITPDSSGRLGVQAISDNGWLGGPIRWSGAISRGSERGPNNFWQGSYGCR